MDYMAREWIHQAIEELKASGVIEVKWVKYKENEEVERVYLNTLQLEKAYQIDTVHCGRGISLKRHSIV